jgi:Fe-S-cluster-containing dehydrogenase component
MVIDVEKCENCHNCFLACKDEHVDNEWPGYAAPQPGEGQSWITIRGKERGVYPMIDVAYLPTPCMHCDDAPCIKAAAEGAITKRPDGIVVIDPVRSKGQAAPVGACPYHAIRWNEALMLPQKCTLCAHLLDDGWTKTRCVQACPTGALSVFKADDVEMKERRETERLEAYEPGHKTRPRVFYKNLYRFTRCFIGGSVVVRVSGRDECAEGARVLLINPSRQPLGECLTDSFGDFKFDDLEGGSGAYTLEISYAGYRTKELVVTLSTNVAAGTILLEDLQSNG